MRRVSDQPGERSRAIDILRALAVLLVLGHHMDRCPASVNPLLHWLTDKWVTGGWIGVDLFFVLSGFLVSGLLFREYEKRGTISVKSFLIRRGFKIYPAFWLMILVSLAVLVWRGDHFKPLAVPGELLFVQNYAPALWGHTWSLAVEEHFYFFLVVVLFLLLKFRSDAPPFRLIPILFGALAVTCLSLRLVTAGFLPGFLDKLQIYPTHLRMDSLFFGVTISYFYHSYPVPFRTWARRWRGRLLLTGLLLLTPAFCFPVGMTPWLRTIGLTQLYLGRMPVDCHAGDHHPRPPDPPSHRVYRVALIFDLPLACPLRGLGSAAGGRGGKDRAQLVCLFCDLRGRGGRLWHH
jgi:peptidoglycan/LPS O-acetylase OafA/YrhL